MADETEDKTDSADLLAEMRQQYEKDAEADRTNRTLALEDLRFINVPGSQWDANIRKERGERPMYEFNKLRTTIKRVINDMRANRPSGKVRATNDDNVDLAEIREGLIRNIWNNSDADTVIDTGADYQVTGGMAAWRVTTRIPEDEVVNQEIVIEGIRNPFCLYADRHAQDPMKRDARHWILTNMVGLDEYEATYGKKADQTSFETIGADNRETWITDDSVRVCEYWYKKPVTKTLLLLQDGRTIDAAKLSVQQLDALRPAIRKSRDVKAHDIYSCIASGADILVQPAKWAGTMFPFVMVYGDHIVIDGKHYWFGLTRFSKDAQRAYNYARSTIIETIALTPQAKWWMTPKQALGLQDSYAEAHKKNLPVMFYNPDSAAPGAPQRMGGGDVPSALIEEAQMGSEDIKATSGIFDNSLGKTANETSGIAIRTRQQQGEIATFNFRDNQSKAVQLTYEICGDLITNVMDGERIERILGKDGTEKFHKLNETAVGADGQPIVDPLTGQPMLLNDMTQGKFSYTVTSGPSYSTQRQEAAETYTQLAQVHPESYPMVADLIYKSMDLPYAEEISERYKAMLPPQLQEQKDGKPLPPEAMQAMQQAAQAMQHVQEMTKQLQDAQAEVSQESASATAEQNKLAIQKAELDAQYEKYMGQIVKAQSALAVSAAQAQVKEQTTHHEDLAQQVNDGLQQVQQMAGAYMQQVQAALGDIADKGLNVVAHPAPPPKSKIVRVKRVNGELHGQIDEMPMPGNSMPSVSRSVRVKRVNGELHGQVDEIPGG